MAKQIVEIGNSGQQLVDKLENNFTELYNDKHSHENQDILDQINRIPIDGEAGRDATINGENVIEIIDSETIVVDISDRQMQFHATGTSPIVLYFVRKDGRAIITQESPTENQIVLPKIFRQFEWGEWQDVETFEFDPDLAKLSTETVIGSLVTAKLWFTSDIAAQGVRFQLVIKDKTDDVDLAISTTIINLNNIAQNFVPATFINKFLISRNVSLSQLQVTLRIFTETTQLQFGIISNPPSKKSFATIATTSGMVGITESQAIKAVEQGQPNFSEANATSAAWSENLATTATLGAGWSGEFPVFTHTAGSTEPLSIPVSIANGDYIEIAYTQTGTSAANTFDIILAASPTSASGQAVKAGIFYSTTFVKQATGNYGYVNIVPSSGWNGTFTLTHIKKAISLNSISLSVKGLTEMVKGANDIKGGGGRLITTGVRNIANGQSALYSNTTGNNNTATGADVLYSNTTGEGNVASGQNALTNNTTGNYNVANGQYALANNTTGGYNVANGQSALGMNTTGSYNTANGQYALHYNTTGSYATADGQSAGRFLSDGATRQTIANNSVFIGANTKGSSDDNQSNQIVIGANAVGFGSNSITLGNNAITSLRCQVTAITALSDIRTKEDVETANLDMCYEDVKRLPVFRYKYKDFTGVHLDKHVTGFLADDVEQVFPKSVQKSNQYFPVLDENGDQICEEIEETDADGNVTVRRVEKVFLLEDVKNITMTEAIPTLWGAVQALMKRVEELESRILIC